MSGRTRGRPERWRRRPVAAFVLRVAILAVPIAVAVGATLLASRVVERPDRGWAEAGWWAAMLAVSTLVVYVVQSQARRLLPLATLLKLSLIFPDQAPSRFRMALRVGTVRALGAQVARLQGGAFDDTPNRAAIQILELSAALAAHDRGTRGHVERVRAVTDLIADELDLAPDDRDRLHWAALLHDIGKLVISPAVLNKGGPLDDHEWDEIHRHPEEGARLTAPLASWLGEWSVAIAQHHERWDGAGYPAGLAAEGIGRGARIVAVADAFDVMTAPRSYRDTVDVATARAELTSGAGTQFDPDVVRAFLNISLGRLRWIVGPLAWAANLAAIRALRESIPEDVAAVATSVALAMATVAGLVVPGGQVATRVLGEHLERPTVAPVDQPAPADQASPADAAAPAADPSLPATPPAAPVPAPPVPLSSATPSTAAAATTTTVKLPDAPVSDVTTSTTLPTPPTTLPKKAPKPVVPPPERASGLVDDTATTREHTPVKIKILANDTVPGLDPHDVTVFVAPEHGTVTINAAGGGDNSTALYHPDAGFTGTDTFMYQVCSSDGACGNATVTVTVVPRPNQVL